MDFYIVLLFLLYTCSWSVGSWLNIELGILAAKFPLVQVFSVHMVLRLTLIKSALSHYKKNLR